MVYKKVVQEYVNIKSYSRKGSQSWFVSVSQTKSVACETRFANSPVWLGGSILVLFISDYTSQNTL